MSFLILFLIGAATTVLSYGCLAVGDFFSRRRSGAFHKWKRCAADYADIPGFCKSATMEEIAAHNFVLTPGSYVGAEEQEDDDEPFEEKMAKLVAELNKQFAESRRSWSRRSKPI